jgi:hypothetical protein
MLLWLANTALASVEFVQFTDPHIFDGKPEDAGNKDALRWCIDSVNKSFDTGSRYNFIVVTGDFGLEGTEHDTPAVKDAKARELSDILAACKVKRWLLVPGNNDLVKEAPKTIGIYFNFVAALKQDTQAQNVEVIDLCPRDGNDDSGVYAVDNCRFIGFNNASFKSNGLAKDAGDFEKDQLDCIEQVRKRLKSVPKDGRAYLFYHIPEVDDPYFELLSQCDPVYRNDPSNAQEEKLRDRVAQQGALKNTDYLSAWTVTENVRQSWATLIQEKDSRLNCRFAGHFHTYLRSKYGDNPVLVLSPDPTKRLLICPPIAIKQQLKERVQGRGYRTVVVDGASGEVNSEIVWYSSPPPTGPSPVPGPAVTSAPPSPPSPTATPKPSDTPPKNATGWPAFWVAYIICATVYFIGYSMWRRNRDGKNTVEGIGEQAQLMLGLFLNAILIGFAVISLLAFSEGDYPFRVAAVGALWALASTTSGGALGFLFGVPRTPRANPVPIAPSAPPPSGAPSSSSGPTSSSAPSASNPPSPPYSIPEQSRTNLEELADVLTKLILGGTLFESNKIVPALASAGAEFAKTVGQDESLWSGAGSAIIIYFGLIGFFGGHFLPRYFGRFRK